MTPRRTRTARLGRARRAPRREGAPRARRYARGRCCAREPRGGDDRRRPSAGLTLRRPRRRRCRRLRRRRRRRCARMSTASSATASAEAAERRGTRAVRDDHHALQVPAIDESPGWHSEDEVRQAAGGRHDPGHCRRPSRREHEQRKRDRRDVRTEVRPDLPDPEQVEVAVTPERVIFDGRRGGHLRGQDDRRTTGHCVLAIPDSLPGSLRRHSGHSQPTAMGSHVRMRW